MVKVMAKDLPDPPIVEVSLLRRRGTKQFVIERCPHCGKRHYHGAGPADAHPALFEGHRVAHCARGEDRFGVGYYLRWDGTEIERATARPVALFAPRVYLTARQVVLRNTLRRAGFPRIAAEAAARLHPRGRVLDVRGGRTALLFEPQSPYYAVCGLQQIREALNERDSRLADLAPIARGPGIPIFAENERREKPRARRSGLTRHPRRRTGPRAQQRPVLPDRLHEAIQRAVAQFGFEEFKRRLIRGLEMIA